MLNEVLVEPDYENEVDWEFIHTVAYYQTGFFSALEYVLKRLNEKDKYNLLTVVLKPDRDCHSIKVEGYEFLGYDLLDQAFSTSAPFDTEIIMVVRNIHRLQIDEALMTYKNNHHRS